MKKQKWCWALITLTLALLISSTAGCITVKVREETSPEKTTPLPVINSFSASPETIKAGQWTTLKWSVYGATTVIIEPGVGTVKSSDSLKLSPPVTTAYTLTASNEAGMTTGSVTVTVTPAVTGKPDLVITDIWLSVAVINYKIKNQGSADAKSSDSYLYVNNLKMATDWIEKVSAGEEKTSSFSNFEWKFRGVGEGPQGEIQEYTVKVCADSADAVEESNEGNNCSIKIWGQKFTYDFVKNAHYANWRSDAGELKWPMVTGDNKGVALRLYDALMMCPQQVSNGWIQGRFADYYSEYGQTKSRPLVIPEYTKFTAKVGFSPDVRSTDGVRVAFGYLDATGSVVLFQKMDVFPGETSKLYQVDISSVAGKKTEFILWVEAKASPEGDCVTWAEPKIVQQE